MSQENKFHDVKAQRDGKGAFNVTLYVTRPNNPARPFGYRIGRGMDGDDAQCLVNLLRHMAEQDKLTLDDLLG